MFLAKETEFLGMVVRKDGIRTKLEKVRIVRDWPKSETLAEIQ